MIPRGIRARLLLAAVASVCVALLLLAGAFNVVLDHQLNSQANALLRARAATALSGVRIRSGHPVMPEAPDAAASTDPIWVFDGTTAIEQPHAPGAVGTTARAMATNAAGITDVPGQATRLLSQPVMYHGARVGTVVAAVSLSPYDDARRTALAGSIALVVAMAALFAASSRWILRRALAPVSQMTAKAADWSEHDLDRRLNLGPPHDELTQLAATLDDLLARLAASLRREQRVSAEISHELRTPLARIQAEADLMLHRRRTSSEYTRALTQIRSNAETMGSIIDTLMEAARHEADHTSAVCDLSRAARSAAQACTPIAESEAVVVEVVSPDTPVCARVEQPLAERILQPLIENACRHGRSHVALRIDAVNGHARVTVADDGNGVSKDDAEALFQPGARDPNSTGAGLGLALARRLARAGNGDVIAGDGPGGEFIVTLPISGQ